MFLFQSHYRSDFNLANQMGQFGSQEEFQSHYRSDFNHNVSQYNECLENFNPIIGLILTRNRLKIIAISIQFQSHYRSDFNHMV